MEEEREYLMDTDFPILSDPEKIKHKSDKYQKLIEELNKAQDLLNKMVLVDRSRAHLLKEEINTLVARIEDLEERDEA